MNVVDATAVERLDAYSVPDARGCLIWMRSCTSKGYGQMNNFGVTSRAARVAYAAYYGDFPPETVDHICRNTRCVNPLHLDPVSAQENLKRAQLAREGRVKRSTATFRRLSRNGKPRARKRYGVDQQVAPDRWGPNDVRVCRQATGLDQRRFAAAVGFAFDTIRDWERGRYLPSLEAVAQIQNALSEMGQAA